MNDTFFGFCWDGNCSPWFSKKSGYGSVANENGYKMAFVSSISWSVISKSSLLRCIGKKFDFDLDEMSGSYAIYEAKTL